MKVPNRHYVKGRGNEKFIEHKDNVHCGDQLCCWGSKGKRNKKKKK